MSNTSNENELTPRESFQPGAEMTDKMRDDKLRRIAKKRVAFKKVFLMYILVNSMLVGIWFFTTGGESYFWPVWPILGWGLGMLFQYKDAYLKSTLFSEEKEFERLKRKE